MLPQAEPSTLERRLGAVEEGFADGKDWATMRVLWELECVTRSHHDEAEAVLAVAAAYQGRLKRRRHNNDLDQLVRALEGNLAASAKRQDGSHRAGPSATVGEPVNGWAMVACVVLAIASGVFGLMAFGVFEFATSVCFFGCPVGGFGLHAGGANAIAVLAGLGLWATAVWITATHLRKPWFLLTLLIGFPATYTGVLLLIWRVGTAIYGPTQY
jgi:hypothetical protein